MTKTRLEAFSDAVIAIIITIMVLEMKAPHGTEWSALQPIVPVFLTYVMSYAYLGIYWNNHHHMLHAADRVTGMVLWANLHLLFWLSLIPFATRWMGENHFAVWPTAVYGFVLLMSAIAYAALQTTLLRQCDSNHRLREAVGRDTKGKMTIALYAVAIALAFYEPRVTLALYVIVALIWLVPDPRIESIYRSGRHSK
ncbi:MAG: TMEM175 family protein [Pirellulales bacterium]